MPCRAAIEECSLSGFEFRVGQVPVGRFGKLSGFRKLCGLSDVGPATLSCRAQRFCEALANNHTETIGSGIHAGRAAHGSSGTQSCRGPAKAVGFWTSSGLVGKILCRSNISKAVGDCFLAGLCRG